MIAKMTYLIIVLMKRKTVMKLIALRIVKVPLWKIVTKK